MALQEIIGDRILVKPSETVIHETKRLVPNTGNFGYLLEYGDYLNGSGLLAFSGAHDLYTINPTNVPNISVLKAKTVREYWRYILVGNISDEAIHSVSPELKLRIELVDAIIEKWNTKLESVLSQNSDAFDQLKASQEYRDIACIAGDGLLPYVTQDARPHILSMKTFLNEANNSVYNGKVDKDKMPEFMEEMNKGIMDIFSKIPEGHIDLGINIDHPASGKGYRLYPKIEIATLSHFLSNS